MSDDTTPKPTDETTEGATEPTIEPVVAEAEPVIDPVVATDVDDTEGTAAADVDEADVATDEAEADDAIAAPVAPVARAGRAKREDRPKRGPKPPRKPLPLTPYAVIETGGKQYRVSVGDTISVEKLTVDSGGDITFDRVLLLGGDGDTRVGTPIVDGAAVTATIDEHYRGEKIIVFKFKAKKRYRRKQGHRQELTRLTITGISA